MSASKRTRRVRYARLVIVAGALIWGATNSGGASAAVSSAPHLPPNRVARAADPAAGRVLGGVTSQHWPVIMTLSSNGRQMGGQVAIDLHCTSGGSFTAWDGWTGIAVPASGSVNVEQAFPPIAGSGGSDSITGGLHTLKGKLNRKQGTDRKSVV